MEETPKRTWRVTVYPEEGDIDFWSNDGKVLGLDDVAAYLNTLETAVADLKAALPFAKGYFSVLDQEFSAAPSSEEGAVLAAAMRWAENAPYTFTFAAVPGESS